MSGRFDALLNPPKPAQTPSNPPMEIPRKPENPKTTIPDTRNSGKPEISVSRKPENLKNRLPDIKKAEKYSTQLDPSLIKQIKQCALENDVKDYEIVQLALKEYLARKK